MQHDPPWTELSLPHVITAVKSRIRQMAWRRLAPFGISPQQYQALMAIVERPGLCHGELARRTWMDKPTASRVLRALEGRGLIEVVGDPDHGRRSCLRLSPEAAPLVEELKVFRREVRRRLEQGIAAEDRVRLRELLGRVMANLDRMEAETAAEGPARIGG